MKFAPIKMEKRRSIEDQNCQTTLRVNKPVWSHADKQKLVMKKVQLIVPWLYLVKTTPSVRAQMNYYKYAYRPIYIRCFIDFECYLSEDRLFLYVPRSSLPWYYPENQDKFTNMNLLAFSHPHIFGIFAM